MNFTLNLTNEDLQVIGVALAQLPYKDVAALLAKMQTQLDAQSKNEETSNGDSSPAESPSKV